MKKVSLSPSAAAETSVPAEARGGEAPWLSLVAEKVKSLHYGVIQIVVHDSHVVQVERTERHRFDLPRAS